MTSFIGIFLGAPVSLPSLQALTAIKDNNSVPWTIVGVLTLLTLLPAILLSITPMVRLLVVFHFLRQALGTQTAPSNQTLMGLGLMMTWFLMQPVMVAVNQQAIQPFQQGQISGWEAVERGVQPPKRFMLRYAREKDLALFVNAGSIPRPRTPMDLPMRVVIPALHALGAEGRFSDRSDSVSSISAGGSGRRLNHNIHRHAAVAASHHFDSAENSAFCDGRWLERAGGLVAEELFLNSQITEKL